MGRKGLFAEKPIKGPGRKAKKQGAPVLNKNFKGMYSVIRYLFKTNRKVIHNNVSEF